MKRILKKSWIQHLAFWVLSIYAIGNYFSISNFLKFIDFIYAGFFHIPLMALVFINLRYHVPRFLLKERYGLYLLLTAFNVAFAYFLHEVIFEVVIPVIPDLYMVSFTDTYVLLTIFMIYLVITTLLKLSKSWYHLQQLEKEKLSLELNSLKLQINPHFLFNTLNSLYSLARQKSDKTPSVILELSNLMRYMIYEVGDEKVELEKEIEAIQNYLDLQKLRVEALTDIRMEVDVENMEQPIAPLLFFPLIENSFKHGLKGEKSNYVHIELKSDAHQLIFSIKNNKGYIDDVEKGKYGGIGLDNVEKRLKLIYGINAEMSIMNEEDIFEVTIKIQWND